MMAMHFSIGNGPICLQRLPAEITDDPDAVICDLCLGVISPKLDGAVMKERGFQLLPVGATLTPSKLRVQCGELEIIGDSGAPGQPICGHQVRAFKDGKPFAFKRLVLTVDVKGIVTVDASFYPKGADPILGQYICEKCGHRMNLGSGDEKKCGACGSEFVRKARADDVAAEPNMDTAAAAAAFGAVAFAEQPEAIITPKQ